MTQPVEPATGAPGAPETGSTSEPQATPGQQPATGGQETATDWASHFDGQTPQEVAQALKFARKWEKQSKENKAQLDKLTAAQQQQGDGPTREELQEQLEAERDQRAELTYRDAINSAAGKAGADAEALRDSSGFRDAVAEKLGDDFDDDELREAVAAVAKAYAKNPRFAKQTGPSSGGADMSGGGASLPTLDQQIADAEKSRDFPRAIGLKRQRAAMTKQ
jgi:hypothetical protein